MKKNTKRQSKDLALGFRFRLSPEAGEGKKVLKTLEIADAVASLNKNIRWLKKDPVVLTKNGRPVAALIAIKNYEKEYQTSK